MPLSYSEFNVLVIEDNLGDYILIQEYLIDGFGTPQVSHAKTFQQAKAIINSETKINVILLDLALPDLSGEELIAQITAMVPDIPLIVLTGSTNKELGFKSLSIRISDYLLKNELSASQLHKSITYSIERNKINLKLKESEEKYRALFDLSPTPKLIYDFETLNFLNINKAAIQHYGYSKEEFLNMSLIDIRPPEDLDLLQKNLEKRSHTSSFEKEIFRHLKKNGEIIDVEIQSSSIDFNGRKARLVLSTDITNRLHSEKALRASEKRFKNLVQEGGDLITIIDQQGVFQYASPNHKAILGFNSAKITGHNILEFIHKEDWKKTLEFYKSLLFSEKRIYSSPYRLKHADGNWIWIESIGTNAIDDSSINGILINSRDVSFRLKNEREIKEINERFEAIAKATSDAIYDYDFKTSSIYLAGSSYHTLFGYQFDNHTSDIEFFKSCIHPEDKENVFAFFNKAAANPKKNHFELEYRLMRSDGTYANILDRFDIIWSNGLPIKKVGAMQDISARKFQETILAFEKEMYELNANPKIGFNEVINKLIANVESLIPDSLCSILLLNEDQSIKYVTGDSIDKNYLKELEGLKIGPKSGSCGTAMYLGKKVIVSDIENDPLWESYAELAKEYDLKACWSVPVKKSSGKVIASFATYYKTIKFPYQEEINLVERVAGLVSVLVENRNSFEETEKAKERYDIVAKATSDTIWDWNIQNDNFSWNRGIQSIFGYTEKEIGATSKWWFDKIHPEDSIKMSVKLYSFLEQKTEKWQDEYRFACADGTYKYVFDRGFLVKDANGKAIRMIGAIQDITQKKQEEQRLKLLETVIIQSEDSVIITESEKASHTIPKIVFVNPAFTVMTGYEPSEVIGKMPTVFMNKQSVKNDIHQLSFALKNKQELKFETLNNKKNGEEYWMNFSMIPITNKEGEHSHWISLQRDITQDKKKEKEKEQLIRELTQNNKDLKQFSYITSHNLRAPLSNLTGLLNLIEDIPIDNPELKDILDGFSKSTHLLNETINDLVKVVIIKDNPSIHKEAVLIEDVFKNVVNQLGFLINLHKPIIKTELDNATILNINKAYLESILLNLLTNAIKYRSTKRQLEISISSRIVANNLEIIFKDNGIGIDLVRNKDKIFGLYQRFHNYPDSKGLGLYLVKSQIESMGGTITAESAVDKGTLFTLTFKNN